MINPSSLSQYSGCNVKNLVCVLEMRKQHSNMTFLLMNGVKTTSISRAEKTTVFEGKVPQTGSSVKRYSRCKPVQKGLNKSIAEIIYSFLEDEEKKLNEFGCSP